MTPPRPPGPDGLPLLGNLRSLATEPQKFYADVHEEYGGLARLSVPRLEGPYLVSSPELVEQVLTTDADSFRRSRLVASLFDRTLGDGLLTSDDDHWRTGRQQAQPAFRPDRIDDYLDVMAARTDDLLSEWEPGRTYALNEEMRRLTLLILSDAVFGTAVDYDSERLQTMFDRIEAPGQPSNQLVAYLVPKWVPIPMWRRYNRSVAQLDALIDDLVAQADVDGETTLLTLLKAATVSDPPVMSRERLRDELVTFLFAGHETTATALTAALFLLDDNPEVRERLESEVQDVLGDSEPTGDALDELSYTEAVAKETLRLYPSAPMIPRETRESVAMDGYELPPGATVLVSQWLVHRDGTHWADPLTFRPERWLRDTDRPEFAYFPFGAGRHRCIGEQFAMTELQFVLASIARRYRVSIQSPATFEVDLSISLRPTDRIAMIPEETD
jgi:cytochrome P450